MRHWTRDPSQLAVAALATYRLTRLATTDTLPPLEAGRHRLELWLDEHAPAWAHGVTCPWCVSIWASAVVTAAIELGHRAGPRTRRHRAIALATHLLAASAAAGVLADLEPH